jgi:hypothetical protein
VRKQGNIPYVALLASYWPLLLCIREAIQTEVFRGFSQSLQVTGEDDGQLLLAYFPEMKVGLSNTLHENVVIVDAK